MMKKKVTYDENTGYAYERPIIELKMENNTHVLRWNKIDSDKFREYRVKLSLRTMKHLSTLITAISTVSRTGTGHMPSSTTLKNTMAVISEITLPKGRPIISV